MSFLPLLTAAKLLKLGQITLEEAVRQGGGTFSAELLKQSARTIVLEGASAVAPAVPAAAGLWATPTAVAFGGACLGGLFLGGVMILGGMLYYGATRPHGVGFGKDKEADIKKMLATDPEEREKFQKVSNPVNVQPAPSEPIFIWLVGERKELIVGRKSVIEEQPSSSLIGWGLDPKKVKTLNLSWQKAIPTAFTNSGDAETSYLASMVPGSMRRLPLACGKVARFNFDSQEHRIDNALRFNR